MKYSKKYILYKYFTQKYYPYTYIKRKKLCTQLISLSRLGGGKTKTNNKKKSLKINKQE